jgi:hypothetical protein
VRNKLLAFLLTLPVFGVSVIDPRWPGIEIEFNATLEPVNAASPTLPGGVLLKNGRTHRVLQDAPHKVYFGYDVVIEASPDASVFQIRVEPLSADATGSMGMNSGWAKLALPNYPVIPEIRLGATVKLDLLVDPATGQKIVDSITVKQRGVSAAAPRDFAVTDAELMFDRPQLRVGGAVVPTGGAGISGAAVWFYVADRGRFTFTLAPHPELGFQRIGEVSGVKLTIRDGTTLYEFECQRPIAPGSGNFFVYGRHEPAWRLGSERFTMGSADRAELIR